MRNDHVTLRSTAVFDLLAPRTPAVPVQVELLASNLVRDIQRREADIALRHVRPEATVVLGLLIGTIGTDLNTGAVRFNLGLYELIRRRLAERSY